MGKEENIINQNQTSLPRPAVILSLYLSMAPQPFVGPWSFFQFLDFFTQLVGLLGRGGSARRKAATYTQDSKDIE
jgi:hypothetical protein